MTTRTSLIFERIECLLDLSHQQGTMTIRPRNKGARRHYRRLPGCCAGPWRRNEQMLRDCGASGLRATFLKSLEYLDRGCCMPSVEVFHMRTLRGMF
ncbi:hypothetical protein PAXRUDRAFT_348657 [Paxillus rubicundulus Ve08.2h10]|uniref:Uncharacterized protein n=1 Tax=Paxillus rubicundulus Ve08.2h10 TaxID=930991 RepID=A0A0D0DRV6_9AGAM|nr:hypothetical protein PAXRUDRAFT_348657 [Paxillus rubicundulus Ve08.2h10]